MKNSLKGVAARVERLAEATKGATADACDKPHWLAKVSYALGDEPVPDWPERGALRFCSCGAALEYARHVIHRCYRDIGWQTSDGA